MHYELFAGLARPVQFIIHNSSFITHHSSVLLINLRLEKTDNSAADGAGCEKFVEIF